MRLILRRKKFFFICPILLLEQKGCLKQILIFLRICSFSILLRKKNVLSISEILSEIVIFWTKKRIFHWISLKMLQNNKKTSFSSEKRSFCLYLSSFTALNKKGFLKQILIFLWICSVSNLLRKTNSLIISELLSEIDFFY